MPKKIETVSVVIPARNEQATIGSILERLNKTTAGMSGYKFETVVVIDSNEDPTGEVARAHGAKVILSDSGRGKGNALYTGFKNSTGEVIVMFDSDGSHNPEEVPLFIAELENGIGLVIGSRVRGGSDDHNVIRLFGNALFTMLMSLLFSTTLMDTLNGFKAFRRGVVSGYRPHAHGFDVEIEITARAIARRYATGEVPTHENKRAGGKMKSNAITDGFQILRACLREGIRYRFMQLFGRLPKQVQE